MKIKQKLKLKSKKVILDSKIDFLFIKIYYDNF